MSEIKLTLEEAKKDESLLEGFDKVHIYSNQWQMYWRPQAAGYTNHEEKAGVWDIHTAYKRTNHCGPEKGIVFVRIGRERWKNISNLNKETV